MHSYLRIDTETVHPVPVHLLLSCLLNHVFNVLRRVECRVVVKQVGHEGKIEVLMTTNHITSTHECSAVNLLRLTQHHLSSLGEVVFLESTLVHASISWSNLSDQISVDHTVLDILAEVVDPPVTASLTNQR